MTIFLSILLGLNLFSIWSMLKVASIADENIENMNKENSK